MSIFLFESYIIPGLQNLTHFIFSKYLYFSLYFLKSICFDTGVVLTPTYSILDNFNWYFGNSILLIVLYLKACNIWKKSYGNTAMIEKAVSFSKLETLPVKDIYVILSVLILFIAIYRCSLFWWTLQNTLSYTTNCFRDNLVKSVNGL